MKRIILASAILLSLTGCVTVAAGIAALGTAAIVATDSLATYCETSTNADAKAAAGCPLIEE